MLFVLLFALSAQDTSRAPRLELAEVHQMVHARSPRVHAARALADAAAARVAQSRRPPDPEIELGFMNYALPSLSPMETIGMTQLQLMQMIPTRGKTGLATRAAGARASAERQRAEEAEWAVRTEAAMVFYDLYRVDRGLDIARRTLRLVQDIRGTAEAMYRVGEGRQADVLRAQVEIARMVEDTVRMVAMRAAMAERLNALLDLPARAGVGSPEMPAFPDSVPALAALLARADAARPMLVAAQRENDAAVAQEELARREIWPDLRIGVQYGQRGSAMGTERMGSLMIGATLPVFARDRQSKMREEMSAMRRMTEADLSDMRARTRGDIATTYANLQRARALGRLYRSTILPQAEAAASSAMAAYRVGQVDFMTLLDDRMAVNEYQQQLLVLEAEEGKAWSELEMLLGRALLDPTSNAGAGSSRGEER